MSSTWDRIRPIAPPTINGLEITRSAFSLEPFLIIGAAGPGRARA